MTNETSKALLLVLLYGSLLAGLYVPDLWRSWLRPRLAEGIAVIWSAILLSEHALQPVLLKRRAHKRGHSR